MTTVSEPDWEGFYRDYRKPGFIPGYEILEKLGGGAFGIVFKARKESIGKDYAVKFLKLDEPGVRGAVMRELDGVSLFAQVDHPNLVTIEDKGEVLGIPFILMGYAGSETLRSRLDQATPTREDALRIFAQVARGLQALHDHSLVHFDLKPGNMFLRGDVARIGDYGLSKLISASHNSLSFGRGTPHYMAPELLLQRGDARSDIYSLGVILYEALSGDVPFRGDSEWEILRKHEREEPSFPPSIERRERDVIARCLQKDPNDRYQSVGEVLETLFGTASELGHHVVPPPQPAHTPPPIPPARGGAQQPGRRRGRQPTVHCTLPPRRRRSRAPGALLFMGCFMILFFGVLAASRDRLKERRSESAAVASTTSRPTRQVRSSLGRLMLPRETCQSDVNDVRRTLKSLRRGKLKSSSARHQLRQHGIAAIILAANELISLDYSSKVDTAYSLRLHAVLGPMTGFRFRSHSVVRGRISRRVAEQNRESANRFWHHVRRLNYR